jgi:hypothetical protein
MKEPVDHILRPHLPWREDGGVTECGYDATKVKTLSRAEYFERLKSFGQQRSALLTCMTCSETARRWGTWADDPREALKREIQWEAGWHKDRGDRLRDELVAFAEIVQTHREEFDAIRTRIEQQRSWNERKAASARKPVAPKIRGGL